MRKGEGICSGCVAYKEMNNKVPNLNTRIGSSECFCDKKHVSRPNFRTSMQRVTIPGGSPSQLIPWWGTGLVRSHISAIPDFGFVPESHGVVRSHISAIPDFGFVPESHGVVWSGGSLPRLGTS
ncbi:hypothetical protein QE152_g30883 [Popillia japonica]|uniref:Uncharacterized protein n=1 Tax=Popillia japonica TaxID=7064 RepID=A0AAW1JCC6_POPJA